MLVNKDGKRIDIGPVSVVRDKNEISGSPEIVNGLSCISCHKHGMREFDDTLTNGHALLAADAVAKMNDITGKKNPNGLRNQIARSRRAYLEALRTATAQFLQQGDDADKDLEKFPEPISAVVRRFDRDLDLNDVATELGIARDKDPELKNEFRRFKERLEDSDKLGLLGLRPLVKNGGKIKRSAWETREDDRMSALQAAAVEVLKNEKRVTPIKQLDVPSEETAGDGN
jgi:serine/threonine-protein kinase